MQEAIDDIQAELISYTTADSMVSEFGTLDLDQLNQLKEIKQKQLETIELQIQERENFFNQVISLLSDTFGQVWEESNSLYEIKYQLEVGLREVDDKISKLEWFVAQVSNYFTDSLTVLNLAITGAAQLSQVMVDSDGSYSTQGLDMSWVEKLKTKEIKTYVIEEKELAEEQLSQRIEAIKHNSFTSVITKTEQIIKAYEDYLYHTNKETLDAYGKIRKSYGEEWDLNNDKMISTIESIEKEFGEKLQISSVDIKMITVKMGNDILDVTGQDGWDYVQFKDLVDTNQPMDLKSRYYSDDLPFSIWSRKWIPDLEGDYLGNYLYGYVGQGMLAVDGDLLKYAAGGAQVVSNTKNNDIFQAGQEGITNFFSGNYFDNPGDSVMIQDGIDAYNSRDKKSKLPNIELP